MYYIHIYTPVYVPCIRYEIVYHAKFEAVQMLNVNVSSVSFMVMCFLGVGVIKIFICTLLARLKQL